MSGLSDSDRLVLARKLIGIARGKPFRSGARGRVRHGTRLAAWTDVYRGRRHDRFGPSGRALEPVGPPETSELTIGRKMKPARRGAVSSRLIDRRMISRSPVSLPDDCVPSEKKRRADAPYSSQSECRNLMVHEELRRRPRARRRGRRGRGASGGREQFFLRPGSDFRDGVASSAAVPEAGNRV